jgi:polyisoprenoid-binding protein YceI
MTTWNIDSAHTHAEFAVKHMMITTVRGEFKDIQGTVDFNEAEPAKSGLDVKIGVASLDSREEKRDAHLKSADFFDAENYPYLHFVSKSVEVTGKNTGKVTGDLTIRDVTRPIVLEVEYNGSQKSPWGTSVAGFTATAKVNRKDWNLNWNVALETGGWLVGDDVKISIESEIIKQAETQAEAVAA